MVDFSSVNDLVMDRHTPDFGRPAEDPEFMLRLCLFQYINGDSDREVVANARINLAYKYFLVLVGLARMCRGKEIIFREDVYSER